VIPEHGHLIDEALRLCQTGAFKQAERMLRQIIDAHADSADAWNLLAAVLYQQGQLDEAAQKATHATQLRPRLSPYWLMHGNIAMARHRYREAQSSFPPCHRDRSRLRGSALSPGHELSPRVPVCPRLRRVTARHCVMRRTLRNSIVSLPRRSVSAGQFSEAMRSYEEAFKRDENGELDRRGFLDLLSRSRFDSLPDFWHDEINRIFRREVIDSGMYAKVGLKALRVKSAFRAALRQAAVPDARLALDASHPA
jgi:tetratricopeptide (TPR) repeat protein